MFSKPMQQNTNVYINGNASLTKSNNLRNQDKYYHIFSKYALMDTTAPKKPCKPKFLYADYAKSIMQIKSVIQPELTDAGLPSHDYYQTKEFSFEKYKLPELKIVAKHYHLHVSGNKPILIERIRTHFRQIQSAIIIQRIFRGHIVRFCAKLRGPAYTCRESCVNETDFYTLEPLKDIPNTSFFSYIDDKQYIYGFDICSIISLISKTPNPVNPYNRSSFPYNATVALYGLYNITKLIYPETFNELSATQTVFLKKPTIQRVVFSQTNTNVNLTLTDTILTEEPVTNTVIPAPVIGHAQRRRVRIDQQREILQLLEPIRARPMEVRVRELFIEVNLLGNYAESRWFMDLDRVRLARFYQAYYDWWHTRSQLTNEIRQNICILDDPFSDVNLLYLYPTTTVEDFREACVRLMENMVYGSREIEYRTLGAMQMLTILTVVSMPARNAMNWLYEAYFT
jgi:hypothetical protein